jgi:hypothetical protein
MATTKKISKATYIQVVGLLAVAKEQHKAMSETEKALAAVLGVEGDELDYFGHVSDAVWTDYAPKQLLKKLELRIGKN